MFRTRTKVPKYTVETTPDAVKILRRHVAGISALVTSVHTLALNIQQRQTDEMTARAEWQERVEHALWSLRRKADKKSTDDGAYERQRNAGTAIL